jgi:hypothetical protein
MLLTEEQTEDYLKEMINHYGEVRQDAVTSEAQHKQKAFEDMKIALFGDDYDESKRAEIT